jgi:type 1 glutamine amidotransferase
MLVYSKVAGYMHPSIAEGITLLQTIASEKGFTVEATETNEKFTAAGLAGFEIVFFMNTSGDVLTDIEQTAFQTWMTTKDGAWAGVHGAVDTEATWDFYHELTGQRYSDHSSVGAADQIEFAAAFASHPAVAGLPNPWARNEEWYNFSSFAAWQSKPGFHILGRKKSDGQPIVWDREIDNYRAFYCGLGHSAATFSDASVKKMLTGGILWAVRRQ